MDADPLPRRRQPPLAVAHPRSVIGGGRLRLRTLVLIRWIAAGGQTATVLAVHFGLGFELPLLPCMAAIAMSAISNLVLMQRVPGRARLGTRDAAILLGFDVVQLGVLLFLTGGLQNPFTVLISAPVIISATILSRDATIALTLLALAAITVLAFVHRPLPWGPESLVLPLRYTLGIWTALSVSTVFMATYVWSVAEEARRMSDALAETQASLAREQRLSALGGLAAAAAHELGSPLATIAVVARELSREVPPDSPIAEDVALLQSQSDRCAKILTSIARRPEAAGGQPFERMPLSALLEDVARPYRTERVRIEVLVERRDDPQDEEPEVARSPAVLHGLGNLIQNAAQFAASRVLLTIHLAAEKVSIAIADDGPGFPAPVLLSIGEPYISTRAGDGEHMGLGVFIAHTLLERTGASLKFRNRGGAEVIVTWPRDVLERLTA